MRRALLLLALFAVPFVASLSFAQEKTEKPKACDVTMEQFMESRLKKVIQDKSLTKEEIDKKLTKSFQDLLTMAPDPKWNEGETNWKKMVQTALDSKEWSKSCRACHNAFKEKYQKEHKKEKVCYDDSK